MIDPERAFSIGLITGIFAFSSHSTPTNPNDTYLVTEVGSDYAVIDYQIYGEKNLTLNNLNLFLDSKENTFTEAI